MVHKEGSRKQLFAFSALFFMFSVLTFLDVNDYSYHGIRLHPVQALVLSIVMFILSASFLIIALKRKQD